MNDREPVKILLVDDEAAARLGMKKALLRENYLISEAENGAAALQRISNDPPDIVLCDINMPQLNGMELLQKLNIHSGVLPLFIMITAYGSEKVAVQAMKAGAYDYLGKPFDIEELRLVVAKAVEKIILQRENRALRNQLRTLSFKPLIGNSPEIHRIKELVKKVAPTDVTVLLTGESGTGKELIAHTIHSQGNRSTGPFITMNCAAIPRDLVESELFGHEKGAFTGATSTRKGKFELADGGTLFLDEIGDMGLDTQSKILRVLEDKLFSRLGGKQVIHADVRLISATNKDLAAEIKSGAFRQDLYFRIKVVEMKLPPLRHRKEDIPLLTTHFLRLNAEKHSKKVQAIEPAALKALLSFDWPGNVRQLLHVIEQCVVLSSSPVIRVTDLPPEIDPAHNSRDYGLEISNQSFKLEKERAVNFIERTIIDGALKASGGNVSKAARGLQMKRQFLQYKIKKLGINPLDYKQKKP